ncbi:MAG: heavy metal-responsive transcriptional regulator [Candidatus Binatus sp.]
MSAFTIGQVASQAGIMPSAVRYYERHRIIPPAQRLPNGYRVYDDDTLRWLGFVRRAQGFGMSLDNVKELLQIVSHGQAPCPRVRQLAREHISEIDENIRDLRALRNQLTTLLRRKTRKQQRHLCPLIES